jgi:hypothetical protein
LPLEMPLGRVEMPMAVRVVNHIVEIRQALLLHEIAEDVHVTVRFGIGGENVMVGDDDDLVFVPDLGVLAELTFEHADGPGTAHVVRHEHVGVHPDVVTGLHVWFAGGAGEDFLGQSHRLNMIADLRGKFNCAKSEGTPQFEIGDQSRDVFYWILITHCASL